MSRDRRGRHGACGTSRGRSRACRSISCSAARAASGSWSTATPTATTIDGDDRATRSTIRRRATRRSGCSPACPASPSTYGVSKDKYFYEPADARSADRERLVDREISARRARAVRGGARKARLGRPPAPRRPPPADADRGGAARQGPRALPARSGWRTRSPAENQDSFRLIRQHTTTPLAVGEIFNSDLGLQAADRGAAHRLYPRHRGPCRRHHPSAPHRRASPSSINVRTGCHGATDLSPVCMARGAPFRPVGAQFRHPGIHAPHRGDRRGLPARLQLRRRLLHPGEAPGLGVDIDETLAAKYPYKRAYLPVNRLEDGTMSTGERRRRLGFQLAAPAARTGGRVR